MSSTDLGPYEIPKAHLEFVQTLRFAIEPNQTSSDGRYKAYTLSDRSGKTHKAVLNHFAASGYVCNDKVYRSKTKRWVSVDKGADSVQIAFDKANGDTSVVFGYSMEAISKECQARLKAK